MTDEREHHPTLPSQERVPLQLVLNGIDRTLQVRMHDLTGARQNGNGHLPER